MMQMARPTPAPRPGVLDIPRYVPGQSTTEGGGATLHKLSSNEAWLGPSPAAVAAYASLAQSLAQYPDGSAGELRRAIAAVHGIDVDRITCTAGSDEALRLLANIYLGPGDEAIYSQYGFLAYPIAIHGAGGTPVVAPEKNFTTDADAILARVTSRTRLVFLANPNNPTGTYLPFDEVRRLHAALPPTVLLVLDAAYAEFVRRNDYESGVGLAGAADNVLMARTFSKVYGLAGLRLGWCYGPAPVIDALNRVRAPFNVSSAAQAAGIAALADRAHVAHAASENEIRLAKVTEALEGLGLKVTPSVGNFVLIHFPDEAGRRAADADRFLHERGVILRRLEPYGLERALRMTIGSEEANEATILALAEFLGAAKRGSKRRKMPSRKGA